MGGLSALIKMLSPDISDVCDIDPVDVTRVLCGSRVGIEAAGLMYKALKQSLSKKASASSSSMAASIAAHVVNNAPIDSSYIQQIADVAFDKVLAIAAHAKSVVIVLEGEFPLKAPEQAIRAQNRKVNYSSSKFGAAVTVPDCAVRAFIARCRSANVALLAAPGEGEAQICYMLSVGDIDVAIVDSCDFDVFAYGGGGKGVIFNVSVRPKGKLIFGKHHMFPDFDKAYCGGKVGVIDVSSWGPAEVSCAATMIGHEYFPGGLSGVGPQKAIAAVASVLLQPDCPTRGSIAFVDAACHQAQVIKSSQATKIPQKSKAVAACAALEQARIECSRAYAGFRLHTVVNNTGTVIPICGAAAARHITSDLAVLAASDQLADNLLQHLKHTRSKVVLPLDEYRHLGETCCPSASDMKEADGAPNAKETKLARLCAVPASPAALPTLDLETLREFMMTSNTKLPDKSLDRGLSRYLEDRNGVEENLGITWDRVNHTVYIFGKILMSMNKVGNDTVSKGYRRPVAKLICHSSQCLAVKKIEYIDCDTTCVRQGRLQICAHRVALVAAIWWLTREGLTGNPSSIPAYYLLPPKSCSGFQPVQRMTDVRIDRFETVSQAKASDDNVLATALDDSFSEASSKKLRKKRVRQSSSVSGRKDDEILVDICSKTLSFDKSKLSNIESFGGYYTWLTRTSNLSPRELIAEHEARASSKMIANVSNVLVQHEVYAGSGELQASGTVSASAAVVPNVQMRRHGDVPSKRKYDD